jgi:hypothetical protein
LAILGSPGGGLLASNQHPGEPFLLQDQLNAMPSRLPKVQI